MAPAEPDYSGYRGMEGGILGAVGRVKERKQRKTEREELEKSRPRKRPGYNEDGTPDGTLGLTDIALRLVEHNNGKQPTDQEVLELLLECPTNGKGRVKEADFDILLQTWNNRMLQRSIGLGPEGVKGQQLQPKPSQGCGCCVIS